MPSFEELRPYADRLGRLLADERGGRILAELQRLRHHHPGQEPDERPAGNRVGVWLAKPDAAGVALRRSQDVPASELVNWADVPYVPPAGDARRVVLIGESAARGWPLDPAFNPATALRRRLPAAAYQCVDLAMTGATAADLTALAGRLPLVRPDVVVAFAGNNWSLPPEAAELRERGNMLADALLAGGYPAMRQAFISEVVLPRARRFCHELAALHTAHGVGIVVVVPEFNLRGWYPAADAEVPVMAPDAMRRWYDLHAAAVAAPRADAERMTAQMRDLDGGTSQVEGRLRGRLAEADGDGAAARAALEESRDAPCGLFLRHTPRAVREVQEFLVSFAARNGFRCVDLRQVLASADLPELPDERCFHDYCHLSDVGMERAMAAVADAVRGAPDGETTPGPGAPRPVRAFAQAHAAAHLAYQGQPAAAVLTRLRAALAAEPGLAAVMTAILEILSCPRPAWTHPAAGELAARQEIADFAVSLAAAPALTADQWVLRECLSQVVGADGHEPPEVIDLLAQPDVTGHAPANWTPGTGHHRATARRSTLAFAFGGGRGALLELTYRMPAAAAGNAVVWCNETRLARLPARRTWTGTAIEVPPGAGRPGVNRIGFDWPVPAPDAAACRAADAAALARGEYPAVLPVFGELFHATLTTR